MMFHAAERPAVPTRKLLDMNQSYAKRPVLGRDGLRRMAVGWKGGLTDMRIDTLVVCAGLLVWTLSGCGGAQSGTFDKPLVSSGTGAADPSISNPTSGSGAIAADSGAQKVPRPESGTNAPPDAMPVRDPADADSGRVPASPMDAGDRKLDAGMSAQPASDASEAGEPMPGAEDAAAREPMSTPKLPPVSSVTVDGPFATTVDASAGPGRAGLVVRPMMLGANGLKHPIFIWGPGRGTQLRDYETLMRRIASHGFVVYSEISQAADGTEMLAAITWLIGENKRSASPYYQKLDEDKIGVGGHSYGSNSAMTASSDPRVKAFVHTAGSGFRGAGKALNLRQPAAFICGADDPTANVTDCRTDYMQTSSPVFFTIIAGEDHLSTPRAGLPLVVAWLRWHLGGETDRKSMFIGTACDYCTGVYTSLSKNWN
jgi:hypothetical protein